MSRLLRNIFRGKKNLSHTLGWLLGHRVSIMEQVCLVLSFSLLRVHIYRFARTHQHKTCALCLCQMAISISQLFSKPGSQPNGICCLGVALHLKCRPYMRPHLHKGANSNCVVWCYSEICLYWMGLIWRLSLAVSDSMWCPLRVALECGETSRKLEEN